MAMKRKTKIWLASIAIGITVIGVIFALLIRSDDRRLVASILKIPATPVSTAWVQCRSVFTSDVLTTCAFSIDPSEFDLLLAGYKIEVVKNAHYARVHDFPMALDLGENFPVAYSALLELPASDAPHGGSIHLFANEARDHVLIHLYVE